jgi:cytochrome c55X
MRLTGGLGPPLTPEALQNKPKAFLENSIFEGRSGTPMPPWKGLLSEADVRWLVDVLKSGSLVE